MKKVTSTIYLIASPEQQNKTQEPAGNKGLYSKKITKKDKTNN